MDRRDRERRREKEEKEEEKGETSRSLGQGRLDRGGGGTSEGAIRERVRMGKIGCCVEREVRCAVGIADEDLRLVWKYSSSALFRRVSVEKQNQSACRERERERLLS